MGLTALPIDLGNGMVVYTRPVAGEACLEQGHYGLRVPEFDVPVTEHGARDGGTVGTTRASARHMRLSIAHPAKWTEAEIRRLFTPGVQRVISTPLGSMPYYVESLSFPDSLWEGQYRFGVNIVSPMAYPRGVLQAIAAQTDGYTTTTYDTSMSAATSIPVDDTGFRTLSQTRAVTPGDIITDFSLNLRVTGAYSGASATSELLLVGVDGKPAGAATLARFTQAITGAFGYVGWRGEYEVPAGVTQLAVKVRCAVGQAQLEAMRNTNGDTYADGAGLHRTGGATWVFGDGTDTSIDWQHRIVTQAESASTTEVRLVSTTELPAYPKVTVTLAANASALTISDGVRTATITGAMTAGDVVILDSDALTLTVNGTDRIAWFDRDGEFPVITPDTAVITTSVAGTIAVEWYPRLMGLI